MKPSDFSPQSLAPGARHTLALEVEAGGVPIRIPVLVVRGARPGKTLVVTAGVHGDEYEGIRTILELWRELDPKAMSGDWIAVPVANPPAFWNGTRTSPLDGGNLARVFPGVPEGDATAVIAWHLDRHILARADFYLDLHSAGIKCLMPTMVGYDASDERSRAAAAVFGAPVMWGHPNISPGRTVSAAKARNIPFLYTEARGAGRIHPEDLAIYRRGVLNLMRFLGMLPGEPEAASCLRHLYGSGDIDQSVSARQRGFLIPGVELLDPVTAGEEIGVLLDIDGECLERFTAPADGVVALIHACPLVEPGEPLFLVASLVE